LAQPILRAAETVIATEAKQSIAPRRHCERSEAIHLAA